MHIHHEILVEADSREGAKSEAKEVVNNRLPVSDWHEIGGRWIGFKASEEKRKKLIEKRKNKDIGEHIEAEEDVMNLGENLQKCMESIYKVLDAQAEEIKNDKERIKEKMEEKGIDSIDELDRGDKNIGHTLSELGDLIAGYYNIYSYFYVKGMTNLEEYDETLDIIERDKDRFWLVTMDIHY